MQRRQALRSILSLPAITAVPALSQEKPAPSAPVPPVRDDAPKLALTAADAAANSVPRFFSAREFDTLRRLADLLVPAVNGKPGAVDSGVPEFLDFLISESPPDRQALYRKGLAQFESEAQLAALHQPWTFDGPADPFARFVETLKQDVLRATLNSREWIAASAGRRGSGVGTYWYSLE